MAGDSKVYDFVIRPITKVIPLLVAILLALVLFAGWLKRDEEYFSPKESLGYWLGIAGGAAMLLLLVYSLRKRTRFTRHIGTIPFWFRCHMMLGIIGPVLIIFHSNFELGSLNSNVAFFTMLTVAVSGFAGRYLYSKIHMGLYGRKAEVSGILAEAQSLKNMLGEEFLAGHYIVGKLNEFDQRREAKRSAGLVASVFTGGALELSTGLLRRRLAAEARRLIRQEAKTRGWSWSERRHRMSRIVEIIDLYFGAVLKAARFVFFERLFAMWHVLHLPLFFLMLIASIVHVWAVHHY